MQKATKRFAIYARTAISQEQGFNFALDAQIQACMQYAQGQGYPLEEGEIYSETASGATANRQLLVALLEAAERGEFTTLLIYDSYRLARKPHLLANLLQRFGKAGVTVETVREVPPINFTEQLLISSRSAKGQKKQQRTHQRKEH